MNEKTYYISIPIAGTVTFAVQASSPEEALEMGWEKVDGANPDHDNDFEVAWEYYEHLVAGNVRNFPDNEVEVWEGE